MKYWKKTKHYYRPSLFTAALALLFLVMWFSHWSISRYEIIEVQELRGIDLVR